MDRYEPYCLADRLFYDRLGEQAKDLSDYAVTRRPVEAGWLREESDTWIYYAPQDGPPLPRQGWKIHLSARYQDAARALELTWDYCMQRGIAFKHLRGESTLVMQNSKAASRSSSGKLVTIYPRDVAALEITLKDLHELLHGVTGPYILSDLRYAEGPLYVRYGGFAERKVLGENGELVLALEDADGNLVPDVRGATFGVPAWTTLPAFLEPHLAARNAVTVEGLPYTVESVLHFSNGGGVYLARDTRSGERVVLKEARPHAGLDAAGRDAVTRLEHERTILERLAGFDSVPALLDHFVLGEHHFIVTEFIDGNPLQRMLVKRFPLTNADAGDEEIAEYTRWALEILPRVEQAVAAMHERGVVLCDLHPNNILVTADGRPVLIDFEVATLAADDARAMLANPAYAAPPDRTGVEVDRWALACLRMGMFAPMTTTTLILHRAKAAHLTDLAAETFPAAAELMAGAREVLLDDTVDTSEMSGLPLPGRAPWPQVRDAMHRAILASATPARADRLFPGDVAQFRPGGGVNFASGAAGVLYALAETGAQIPPEHVQWLAERAPNPEAGSSLGFYDGLAGVAYTLHRLGRSQEALDVADICLRENWEGLGLSLSTGLSGLGLGLLHLGDPGLSDTALKMAALCAERLGGPQDVPEVSGGDNPHAGLMHGSSGPALLFLAAYDRTGDAAMLEKAHDALQQDLRRCIQAKDGSLQVNQGWRYLPYLDEGSVGIGLAVARYLEHANDPELRQALDDLTLITRSRYFVQSGLFAGRAGIIASLAMGLGDGRDDPALDTHVRGLGWHALPFEGGLAFPGDQLLRLSMDFSTGTAGVLFALAAALDEQPLWLPFLKPSRTPQPSAQRKEV